MGNYPFHNIHVHSDITRGGFTFTLFHDSQQLLLINGVKEHGGMGEGTWRHGVKEHGGMG